ncbi:eCIS core domain-containing protein [Elioraea rosea]|uniref:eCIS core domain-containing protein n=1 Tax=Elioraea rosea TaxID=2492390 RepID=UPI0019507CCE|nr:DUF4157 domain-containing protein [Elioraea rosea]
MRAFAPEPGAQRAAAAPPPSFRIGAANDAAEGEADAIAARVLEKPVLRRTCAECEREQKLSRAVNGGALTSDAQGAVGAALAEGGQPLAAADARGFGDGMGADFSAVRVHTGAAADRAARSVGARAFALGGHLVFANGEYRPEAGEGRRLLAHELAHVRQEGQAPMLRRQAPAAAKPRNRSFDAHGVTVLIRSDCETTAGFSFALMKTAVTGALDAIFKMKCIAPKPRAAIQANLKKHGLDFHCDDSANLQTPGVCAEATGFSIPANIFTIGTAALTAATCGPLASTILHEIIHVVRGQFGEDLPRSCEASCFGQAGDPKLCRGS